MFGFAAIVFASRAISADNPEFFFHKLHLPYFTMSCYMIFLAMIADVLDGRVARMSHSTSSFGGQLDSLCDMISFGVAPAFLMLKVLDRRITAFAGGHEPINVFVYRFVWLTAAIYIGCAAIRLARFNVENEEDEAAHMSFMGLPAPGAAGLIASLVFLYQDLTQALNESGSAVLNFAQNAILMILPTAAALCGILMISRLRYQHVVNQYLKGKKPFTHLLKALGLIVIIAFSIEVALLLVFGCFAFSGLARWIWAKASSRFSRCEKKLQPADVSYQ